MPERPQVFFDTIVLSNFARAGCLKLLVTRYRSRMAASSQVLDELIAGVDAGFEQLTEILELAEKSVLHIVPLAKLEMLEYRQLLRTLGEGEAAVIALAKSRGAVVATDDRAARDACARLKIPVTGTLGILAAAYATNRFRRTWRTRDCGR
jgi:predicted nucleic acid-binding protein